jgi:transketolase N-terminal domain/subunit
MRRTPMDAIKRFFQNLARDVSEAESRGHAAAALFAFHREMTIIRREMVLQESARAGMRRERRDDE